MHHLVFSDAHLNIIMELLSNAPYRIAVPVIQEIAKQIQAEQQPPQAAAQEIRVGGGNGK